MRHEALGRNIVLLTLPKNSNDTSPPPTLVSLIAILMSTRYDSDQVAASKVKHPTDLFPDNELEPSKEDMSKVNAYTNFDICFLQ